MTRLRWALIAVVVIASLVAERLAHHKHEYWFTGIPAFFVLFGFIGCAAIIYFAKAYGKYVVDRPEDYYERHGDLDGHRALTGAGSDTSDEGEEEAQ